MHAMGRTEQASQFVLEISYIFHKSSTVHGLNASNFACLPEQFKIELYVFFKPLDVILFVVHYGLYLSQSVATRNKKRMNFTSSASFKASATAGNWFDNNNMDKIENPRKRIRNLLALIG